MNSSIAGTPTIQLIKTKSYTVTWGQPIKISSKTKINRCIHYTAYSEQIYKILDCYILNNVTYHFFVGGARIEKKGRGSKSH